MLGLALKIVSEDISIQKIYGLHSAMKKRAYLHMY